MTSELDIYRSAQAMIKQHSEDAPIHAAMRADELAEAGDMEGCVTWRRVVRAIKELLDKPEGERVH
jgi:hypothetical protein